MEELGYTTFLVEILLLLQHTRADFAEGEGK